MGQNHLAVTQLGPSMPTASSPRSPCTAPTFSRVSVRCTRVPVQLRVAVECSDRAAAQGQAQGPGPVGRRSAVKVDCDGDRLPQRQSNPHRIDGRALSLMGVAAGNSGADWKKGSPALGEGTTVLSARACLVRPDPLDDKEQVGRGVEIGLAHEAQVGDLASADQLERQRGVAVDIFAQAALVRGSSKGRWQPRGSHGLPPRSPNTLGLVETVEARAVRHDGIGQPWRARCSEAMALW